MSYAVVQSVRVFPLSIPLRGKVSHATSVRGVSDSIVVALELYDGPTGYGETLPRKYVTGESVDTVLADITDTFVPCLVDFHPNSFAEAMAAIDALPWKNTAGKRIPAARAAVELALIDAVCRFYERNIEDVAGWLGLPGFAWPGCLKRIRYTGVLASSTPTGTRKRLRLMRWGGMRDFKLKVGVEGDRERLAWVCKYLGPKLGSGGCTLRLDANGAWTPHQARQWLNETSDFPYQAVEQPLAPTHDDQLVSLRKATKTSFIFDESLITRADGERLIESGVAGYFNIRISKCGGLLPSLALAALAKRHHVGVILGCMVGETSILSSAALRFLSICPYVRWAEGCFGSFLMLDDVVRKPLRFGYGGRPPRTSGEGLGCSIMANKLETLSDGLHKTIML
ncbi:MAG: mandelate racemase/muconate lactonizing enzyme family protein [Planctomycetota bacterium]|jgi:muconate cycloisomerase